MLYIVSTPIGHLEDITGRALKALAGCDAILCEDTRRTSILLGRYAIDKPLISYHQFKEKRSLTNILQRLKTGETLALVSDAGTPCINDPGYLLVEACIKENIPFTPLPGPCSVIQALVMSGCKTERFQFIGFLPKKPEAALRMALHYPGTTVCFDSPQRLVRTLALIGRLDAKREVAIAREMTKTFEECVRGNAAEVHAHFQKKEPRGEIVLVIQEGTPILEDEKIELEELIEALRTLHGLSLKEAIAMAAKLQGVPKKTIYNQVHKKPSFS